MHIYINSYPVHSYIFTSKYIYSYTPLSQRSHNWKREEKKHLLNAPLTHCATVFYLCNRSYGISTSNEKEPQLVSFIPYFMTVLFHNWYRKAAHYYWESSNKKKAHSTANTYFLLINSRPYFVVTLSIYTYVY